MAIGMWTQVDRLDDPDSPYALEAVSSASYILYNLTGQKFGGVRTTTETYCQSQCGDTSNTVTPVVTYGEIQNCCGASSCNGCAHTLWLRGDPIVNILSVTVGGTRVVPLDDVEIIDRRQIAPARGCWGTCDDITVSYQYGDVPPAAGVNAATELANQFIWGATGDDRCELPAHVTSVTRQGVSWTLLDNQDFLEKGRTGIYLVDLFIAAVNPDKARKRPRVFSPDIPSGRTRRSAAANITAPRLPSAP